MLLKVLSVIFNEVVEQWFTIVIDKNQSSVKMNNLKQNRIKQQQQKNMQMP